MKTLTFDRTIADMIEKEEKVTRENIAYILGNAVLADSKLLNHTELKSIISENIKRVSRCLEKAESASPELVPGLAKALAYLANAL